MYTQHGSWLDTWDFILVFFLNIEKWPWQCRTINGVAETLEAELTTVWFQCKSNRKTIYKCGQDYEEEEEEGEEEE